MLAACRLRFQGWVGKRLTVSFGWHYDFDSATFGAAEPMPDWLRAIRSRAAQFAGLPPDELVQALLTRYDPGAGIGWHRDRPLFEHVIGISLGVPATMRFRKRSASGFERASAPLAPRSIYHLSGEARHEWEPSITAMEATRWSITFRSLSEKGCAQQAKAHPFFRSPRSPCPGLTSVLAAFRRSAASDLPTSSDSLNCPLPSRRT
jgi:hypothetical protein